MKFVTKVSLALLLAAPLCAFANTSLTEVPEPFRGFDEDSTYAINYDDLTAILKTVVIDVGRSSRRVPDEAPDVTGTRMKTKISRTANEGNRFYFEAFKNDEAARAYLLNIQKSLEQLPNEAPLSYFSRDEQLAYWLNLYNVTVLNQVIEEYPRQNLKKLVEGKDSVFTEKLLNVAGVPLSLNDIQFRILKDNYGGDPLIIYGLYQGIVGGPNIRESAYTGANVYNALKDNAAEFVNSNRGTYAPDDKMFRVSSLYGRNTEFFPDFDSDLTAHLLDYLEGEEYERLKSAGRLRANIDDWNVTDLGGSNQRIGGSFATSRAALLDSVKSTTVDPNNPGGILGAAVGSGSSEMAERGVRPTRVDPALIGVLQDLNEKRLAESRRDATVTIDDIEDSETGSDAGASSQNEE